jgi:hypothetical protein
MTYRPAFTTSARSIFPITLAAVCGLFAQALPASAMTLTTYVSGNGKDAGNCIVTAPCRTFKFALTETTTGGRITVLSASNYGPVSINKSVSIVANGGDAGIVGSVVCPGGGSSSVCIYGSGTVVSLQGLTIDNNLSGTDGIRFVSGVSLEVRHSSIRRTGGYGINFTPSVASKLEVSDTILSANKFGGVQVLPSGTGDTTVVIDRSQIENHLFYGIRIDGTTNSGIINGTVRDSSVSGNAIAVYIADNGAGAAQLVVDRTSMARNPSTGVTATGAGATAQIGNCTISGSDLGINPTGGGTIYTFGNNQFSNNGSDGTATGAIPLK